MVAARCHSSAHHAITEPVFVSGAYVISANRTGQAAQGQRFGGHGMAYSPSGQPLTVAAKADDHGLLQVVRIDLEQARRQKREYPCYLQNVD